MIKDIREDDLSVTGPPLVPAVDYFPLTCTMEIFELYPVFLPHVPPVLAYGNFIKNKSNRPNKKTIQRVV